MKLKYVGGCRQKGIACSAILDSVSMTRYRCKACGNVTRFDVTVSKKTKSFYHFSIGGDLRIESEEVLEETVDEVSCRWCGHSKSIEKIEGLD